MSNSNIEYAVKWMDVYPQFKASTIMSLTSISGGLSNTFINLLDDIVDKETKSWLASVTSLFTIIGTLVAGPAADKIGRKRTLLAVHIISMLSWILIFFADKDWRFLLFIGIPLTGVVRGGIGVTNVVFVPEIMHKKYRSTMLSFTLVYFTFGMLLTSLLGLLVSWKTVCVLCFVFFAIIFVLALFHIIESPIWLMNIKMDSDEAKRSLGKLNPNKTLFKNEWQEMKTSMLDKEKNKQENVSRIKFITNPSFLGPAKVLFGLLALSQMSGVNFMMYFVVDTLPEIGHQVGKTYKKEIFLVIGISKFLISFFTTSLSVKFGRKQLLYASGCGTLCSSLIIILCSLLYVSTSSYILDWIMLLAYVVYISFGSFGVWLIPYTLIGELLPNDLRGFCSPLFICYSYGVMSLGAKAYPYMLMYVSIANIFLYYALVSIFTSLFVYLYVPETSGKTLKEIEDYFIRKSRKILTISQNVQLS